MPIEIIRDVGTWEAISEEWNRLLSASAAAYPFLRCEYLRAWWDHLGAGEWPAAELRIAVWREDGSLAGVAPLFRTTCDGEHRLLFIGSAEISDYLDLVAAPDRLPSFCAALFESLAAFPASEFAALDLFNLHASSPTIPLLEAEAERRGWGLSREFLQVCPAIALPRSWEDYLASLDKKTRHEIRRKLRRAEGGEGGLTLHLRGSEASEEFLRLMACDGAKARFLTPSMRAQFRSIADAAQKAEMLQLAFLEMDNANIAAFFNFTFGNRIWVYNSGMDPKYAALSPGWVLLALLIRKAIEDGFQAFDFMRGDEPYKFQWGGRGEKIFRLKIRRT
ncbi:MAG: GNAT family N-acetyltransferase [Anaerolineales bacterium]|nr:GNAT family N-acetyltransferase [Anaerolineales bacterium]